MQSNLLNYIKPSETLPNSLFGVRPYFFQGSYDNLTYLNFSYNRFSFIPPLKAPQLIELFFNNCQLNSVDEFAKVCYANLQFLNLSENKISTLPKFALPKIQ